MAQITKEEVMAKLAILPIGQIMLISSRRVEDATRVQLEFAEVIKKPTMAVVGLFNQSDKRFKGANVARRAWLTVVKEDFKKQTGIDVENYVHGEEINKKGVTFQIAYIGKVGLSVQGMPMHLQVVETQTPTSWQLANIETSAKQDGKNGYLLADGKPIFSNVTVVAGEPKHKMIDHDEVSLVIPTVFNVIEDDEDVMEPETVEAEGADAKADPKTGK